MADRTWKSGPKQVHIHLTDKNDPIPWRRIVLDAENNSIEIGRASKVPSKGFLAAPDNTWFNSPVMSRHHAEIVADLDRETVSIIDKKSLHGTFVNSNIRLLPHEPKELKQGDNITLGAAIFRNADQFLPTMAHVAHISFKAGSVHRNVDSTATFQVPDGSDCSSDVGDDNSSDEDSIEEKTVTPKPLRPKHIIDLTKTIVRDVIDLSSPPSSPLRMGMERNNSNVIDLVYDGNGVDYEESNDEDYDEEELHQDHSSVPAHSSPTTNVVDIDDDMDLDLSRDEEIIWSQRGREDSPSDESDSESYVDYPEDEEGSVAGTDNSSENESDLDEDMGSDDGDIFGGDSDGSDNEAFEDDGPLGSLHRVVLPAFLEDSVAEEQAPRARAEDIPPVSAAAPMFVATSSSAADLMSIEKVLNGNQEQQPNTAASSQNILMPGSYQDSMTYPLAVEEMGQKTGKMEFFAAREHNKALFSHSKPQPIPFGYIIEPAEPEEVNLEPLCEVVAAPAPAQSLALNQEVNNVNHALCSSKRTHVGIQDIIESAPKKLKRKADDIADTTEEEERWAISEKEQIQTATGEEEAEGTTQDRVRDNAPIGAQEPSPVDVEMTPYLASSEVADEQQQSSRSAADVLQTPASQTHHEQQQQQQQQQPPAKRIRLFRSIAEHVGMAAIGGAMVMGTLIYTAPTFA